MKCPECQNELGARATYCPCGWKAKRNPFANEPAKVFYCSHPDCAQPAMCSIEIAGERRNLCEPHYYAHAARKGDQALIKHGLTRLPDESQAQHTLRMRQWLKSHFPNMDAYRIKPEKPTREPGEDEDYQHRA